jgi:hypothetical protein
MRSTTAGSGARPWICTFEKAGTLELGGDREEWVARRELLAAAGDHQHQLGLAHAVEQEDERVTGRVVHPVRVLDDDDRGLVCAEAFGHAQKSLEEASSLQVCAFARAAHRLLAAARRELRE